MRSVPRQSPERHWARGVILYAEQSLPPGSDWLASTRALLDSADERSLRLLRDVLAGRTKVAELSDIEFDLYFGLRIFFASRSSAPVGPAALDPATVLIRVEGHDGDATPALAMPRGAQVIAHKAQHVLGSWPKAWRWLSSPNPILGGPPLALANSRTGRRLVYEELQRIDWGDFT